MKLINLTQTGIVEKDQTEFAAEITSGLSQIPKKIPSKYFYDDIGSQLFQEITRLEEYYLTRKEFEILNLYKETFPELINEKEIDIVELGVGDGHKTKLLIEGFIKKGIKVHFYPVDISTEALHQLESNISAFREIEVEAIAAEYLQGLEYVNEQSIRKKIVLFLGSNIGNFSREEEAHFLKNISSNLRADDYLLIGFDLKKDINIMTAAYSDSKGVTAHFNLNLLERINHELEGDFDIKKFRHLAQYNPVIGAMESFLISLTEQTVTLKKLNKSFHFEEFEPIHMEYSFKFTEKEIEKLSLEGGFTKVRNFSDPQHFYVDSLWRVQ